MKVLVADKLNKAGVEALQAEPGIEVDVKTGLKPEELKSIIGDYEGLVVRSDTKVTAEIIEAGKKLMVVGRAGVGVDNIDLKAATQHGVIVVNAPTSNTTSAAEHAFGLMLALARHIPQANIRLKEGFWERSEYVGSELKGKCLGVIGLGNVGSEVSRRAIAFEMRVLGYDPFVSAEYAGKLGVELVELPVLLKESDFITLHIPSTADTKGLIGEKELALLKPTVRIINCARGGLINEELLYKAVEEGQIAGAAIDVFSKEPATDNILLKSGKIIVTPHLGASTVEAQAGVAIDIAEEILSVLKGKTARYTVNAPKIPAEVMSTLAPFMNVASMLGSLARQIMEGQLKKVQIMYNGEIANQDATALNALIIGGLLEGMSEERVNLVNASIITAQRGIKVVEQKEITCENYANLITLEVTTSTGKTTVAGTVLRGESHVVRVNDFWLDMIPTGGYFLLCDHNDRPGLIGAVGTITGEVDINISSMQLARLQPRGHALMILALDEPIPDNQMEKIIALPDVNSAKLVKL
jgi:D-3-phosphoglycerate dehydrogenase